MKTTIIGLCVALAAAAARAGAECVPSRALQDKSSWACVQGGQFITVDPRTVAASEDILIKDQGAWRSFCGSHGLPELPVDFQTQVVVGVSVRTGECGHVYLGAPRVDSGKITFSYHVQMPATGFATECNSFAVMRMAAPAAAASVDARPLQPEASDRSQAPPSQGAAAQTRVAQALAKAGFALRGDGSVSVNASAYNAAFDGSLNDAVTSPAAVLTSAWALSADAGRQKAQASCTPGIDCPQQGNAPRRQQPSCTPGIDCPQNGGGQSPSCTPNVDCPGDGSGSGNGNAPLPPNYEPRPSNPPSSFPPVGSPSYHDSPVDTSSYWMTYRDWLGRADEEYGNWSRTTGTSVVNRGGKDVGSQGTDYTATLQSSAERNVYRLYWRYAGHNCNPNDASQCESWSVEYAYFYDRAENGQTKSVNVEVAFRNDKTLLPWEKESITLTFDGGQVGVDTSGAAFNYSVRGPILDQQRGTAYVELTPTSRILRRPESDKVSMTLVKNGGALQLIVDDSRDQYYDGESLEITVQVKMDSGHWYSRDKVVFERKDNGPISVRIAAGKHPQAVVDVPNQGSGKYYIKGWSFRRAQSKISSADWIERDKGNTVQY